MSAQPKEQTIFVVDDEFVIAQTVTMILRGAGYEAQPFSEPKAALDAVACGSPDLLLTDLAMPEMNGIDLAMRMQELRPSCKVLVFSGQPTSSALVAKAQNDGHHFGFVSKPVHPSKLLEKIEHIMTDDWLGGAA